MYDRPILSVYTLHTLKLASRKKFPWKNFHLNLCKNYMNKIKEIAEKTFKSLPMDNNKPEQWIDNFVIAYTRAILFEATDVIREKAKEHEGEIGTVLKATAIDVLDHFEL